MTNFLTKMIPTIGLGLGIKVKVGPNAPRDKHNGRCMGEQRNIVEIMCERRDWD